MSTQNTNTGTFAHLRLSCLVASQTNPRTIFDPAWITELAEDIKYRGVMQPVLVRPLPGARVADTARGVTHEIVEGECRWRSSIEAGLETIPAMIKDLTDLQVIEIQLISFLKRKGLTSLEEAQGYQSLMTAADINVDEVAKRIRKSRSYVFGRLKLLDLCTEARASLRTGAIDASCALLVARIPDSKLQIKAVKEILEGDGWGSDREPMSHRAAKAHIQDRYMIKLDSAKFDIKCIDLVPDAGSCKTCAKRTGHDPDLFSDVKGADVCIDPPCFHAKEVAHAAVLVEQAKAKGQTVIAGRQALELMPQNGYNAKFKGYRRLDDATDSPTDKPLRKIIGKQMAADGITPIMIEHPHKKGELVAVLPNEVVARLLKTVQGQADAAKSVSKEVKQLVDEKNTKAAAKEKEQFEQGWRDALLAKTWATITSNQKLVTSLDLFRYLARKAAQSLNTDDASDLCKLLDLGKVAPYQAVLDWVKETPEPDHALALLTMHRDSDSDDYDWPITGRVANEGLMLVAGNVFGYELSQVIEDIKESLKTEVREAKAAKSPKPLLPLASAAQAKGGGGGKGSKNTSPAAPASVAPLRKRKLTADEAQAAIAAAMQGQETNPGADAQGDVANSSQPVATAVADAPSEALAVGMRVCVTSDTNVLQLSQCKWAGKEGTVTQKLGDRAWMLTFKGRTGGMASFDGSELVLTPRLIKDNAQAAVESKGSKV